MHDFKLALRQFRRSPGFAAAVILTISLGIGANTAIFTLVHAILLKSLPVANPASLYRIGSGTAKAETTEYVSGNYFSTFGLGAYAGRVLLASDDSPGAAPVAVMSYLAWQAAHGADPGVIGATCYIQNQPFTIVGISPPGFFGDRIDSNPPALWIPLNDEPILERETSILKQPDTNWLYVLGRVRPGVNPGSLQAKL